MASSDDRPALTIRVTREMIEAGIRAFHRSDQRFSSEEEIVSNVYREMRRLEVIRVDPGD